MSSTTTSTYTTTTRHTLSRRNGRGLAGIATASTPNLNQLYSSQHASHSSSRLAPAPSSGLMRKASYAALTQSSLASIPDDTEAYAFNSVLTNENTMPPLTPGRLAPIADLSVGDVVDVPGNMTGTVRFVGSVAGRKGTFAGVELHRDYAARGKNNGDVDGVHYFTTTHPGAGIFLPLSKALRRDATPTSSGFPHTPTGLKMGTQNSTNYTPPTPSLPKFSQSMGPGRAASPVNKAKPRTSLPRPDSPVRRLQMTPGPRPSIVTPGPKTQTRFGSPTSNKFAQSVRGTAGDPSKRPPGLGHTRKASLGPRSASAMGNTSTSAPGFIDDDELTPVQKRAIPANGSIASTSSFGLKVRPASRATSRAGSRAASRAGGNYGNDDEVERLKAQLEDRNRQLKEQGASIAEMESALTELQGLIENPEGPPMRRGSTDDKDSSQLRALLREKNEKIAMLTAEFDAHRADFRSTIDTLEMASTETERVYEKKIEELMQEIQELHERTADVDTVATQLKQLEELVQELEEGLEDARRGEAEARGDVEFLRGEVERTRTELRREREMAQVAMNGSPGPASGNPMSKELEQKEDEIRGLKAIIHSLSSSVPNDDAERTPTTQRMNSFPSQKGESIEDRLGREKMERELAELRAALESKTHREEELEREVETLRRGSTMAGGGPGYRGSAMTIGSASNERRNSFRDSRGTVVLAPRSPEAQHKNVAGLRHSRGHTLDTMPESDSYSTATESSALWCEICESHGHDILTCTNMFGPEVAAAEKAADKGGAERPDNHRPRVDSLPDDVKPAPLSPVKAKPAPFAPPPKSAPNPSLLETGPVAGKDSGVVDAAKWCALCERDGHGSVDCPFEDEF
ncbi:Tip elongation protein 1 [Podospora conica]|nr:Tip elongation protein 1 [Schizothecium conicum]